MCLCVCCGDCGERESSGAISRHALDVRDEERSKERERERVWSLFVGMVCMVMKTKDFVKTFELRVFFFQCF